MLCREGTIVNVIRDARRLWENNWVTVLTILTGEWGTVRVVEDGFGDLPNRHKGVPGAQGEGFVGFGTNVRPSGWSARSGWLLLALNPGGNRWAVLGPQNI
jgi:hypothetical protein